MIYIATLIWQFQASPQKLQNTLQQLYITLKYWQRTSIYFLNFGLQI